LKATINAMPESRPIINDFLSQITAIVEENISDEQFGVSELADAMHMSRSNLLRKVKKETKLSVSQLIRQVRLKRGMELLRTSSFNVSEVSHQVGFNSTSYFIKCFREQYGYPPGEVGKRDENEISTFPVVQANQKRKFILLGSAGLMVALVIGLLTYYLRPSYESLPLEKSIAVLPFKNDSNDSTNLYLINGLMESTLNNLQKIKDLRVISRTSSEKYRNTSKSIPEMAKELNVSYFVEGSGQKIGDQILLNVQLIEASSDRHLWAKQYESDTKDIFELQQDVAKNIAEEIQAIITPEEARSIEKKPTDNLVAYDLFLKGQDLLLQGGHENLEAALPYFKKAIAQDHEFALAYAEAAITYYYLDIFQEEKKYALEIDSYANKAILFDENLAESLVAKAMVYIHKKEYELAVPYLERALEYNPNSMLAIEFLSDFYWIYIPNTTKYLEYALKGVRLNIASHDSTATSINYLRLSHALLQTGFIEEALLYIDKSLAYNSENPYSGHLKAWILFFKNKDMQQTRELLIKELNKDTTRLDILQDVGKICYFMGDYESAYRYYKRFIELRENQQLEIYQHENLRIGMLFSKMGHKEKSEEYVQSFKDFADNDRSIYKHMYLAGYYSYRGDTQKAIEHLKLFSKEDNYVYWILLWDMEAENDPMQDHPEFTKIMGEIESKFWNTHKEIRARLEEEDLL
jgi:TolB-like protein/AraC-like DNA-binding protein/Tfp pilus assembly protein PilF